MGYCTVTKNCFDHTKYEILTCFIVIDFEPVPPSHGNLTKLNQMSTSISI